MLMPQPYTPSVTEPSTWHASSPDPLFQTLHPVSFALNPPSETPTLSAGQVTAEGYESDLQQLLTWLHSGSPQADVSGVEVTWSAATGEFDDFDTLWTA
jgi:hypothetical protein